MTFPKPLLTATLCLCLAGCGQPETPPAAAAPPSTPPGDPVADALIGSAQRTLERRYPGDAVLIAERAVAAASGTTQVCGRFILVTKTKRRDRFFVVTTVDLTEMKTRENPRWRESCADARPLPGADPTEIESQVAALAQRQALVSP